MRYILFKGYQIPDGGWNDVHSAADNIAALLPFCNYNGCDWWHVVDIGQVPPKIIERDPESVTFR